MADQDNNGGVDDAVTGTEATPGIERDPADVTHTEGGEDSSDAADADADVDGADAGAADAADGDDDAETHPADGTTGD